jgi:outer membrane protein assembly factor BamB
VQFVSEDGDLTYVSTGDGELWAVDSATGDVRYRGKGAKFSVICTNITDSTIYAATADGVVYAIKPALRPGSPGYVD